MRREELRAAIFAPGVSAGGGAERTALVAALALRQAGMTVTVFTDVRPQPGWVDQHFGMSAGLTFSVLDSGPSTRWLPEAVRALVRDWAHARAIKRSRPDVFCNFKYKSELPGLGKLNIYYVHFPHRLTVARRGVAHHTYLLVIGLLRRLLNSGRPDFRTTFDLFLANSEFTRTHVQDRWRVDARVVYPPCPIPSEEPSMDRRPWIVSIGRFQAPREGAPHKNQLVLVDAFAQLQQRAVGPVQLHLIGALGDDPEDRAFFERVEERGAGREVFLHPNLSSKELTSLTGSATLYWHAQGFGTDLSAAPEAQEHFGISTVEAMAAGAVPLVYATAGPREVVAPVSDLLMWSTVADLIETSARLLKSEDLTSLRSACRARSERFSEQRFVAEIREICSEGAPTR